MHRILPVAVLTLAACAHQKIAGTEIEDNTDTRAILDVMSKYRIAVEAKDVSGITALLDPSFKDDGGTSGADDDLDYNSVPTRLSERFAKIDNVKLDLDIRKVKVENDIASAVYHYNTNFTILSLAAVSSPKAQKTDSDIKQMSFKRVAGEWKITSGI